MEGFDLINTGVWSIVPPLLALILALVTKEVYSALIVGVFAGMIIYQFTIGGAGFEQLLDSFVMVPLMMADQIAGNGALLLFLALLGILVVLIAAAGGSRAYAEWVSTHIKNARMAQLLTAVLGIIIFVDDYFNCLTVGAVMRPVTDRFKISREKLAWLIDSCAAPICIIAPVSSWAVAVSGYLGEGGFATFVKSIPFNFYALLTIAFVLFMCISNIDFASMKKAQEAMLAPDSTNRIPPKDSALETLSMAGLSGKSDEDMEPPANIATVVAKDGEIEQAANAAVEEFKGMKVSDKGRVFDLVIPIVVLIVFSILGMLYVGGFFRGVDFATAVGEDPVLGLCVGACVALLVCAGMFLPRKLMKVSEYMEGVAEGVRSMVGAMIILVLAWSLGGACRYLLGTGEFVSSLLSSVGVGLEFLPAVVFVIAAFIGFSMGTSWGTIALILPIVVGVFAMDDPLFLVAVGAALAGAVYGDHISPISDTTILSSAGAQCNHLRHVSTQIPYATVVAIMCLFGYLLAGFTGNPWISLIGGAIILVMVVIIMSRMKTDTNEASKKN